MSGKPPAPERRTYYYRRGGIPTPAAEWKSKEKPDLECVEGCPLGWRPYAGRAGGEGAGGGNNGG